MLDVELDELFGAPQRRSSDEEAPKSLIPGGRIELIVTLVSQETRSNSTKPDWLRVALDLLERKPLAIRAGCRARQIEYADSLEVVAKVHDEIQRIAFLKLEVHCVAISTKTHLPKPSREQ